MHGDFATWLNFVIELHVCCQDTSGQAEADFRTFESEEKANDILHQQQEKLVTEAEKESATKKTLSNLLRLSQMQPRRTTLYHQQENLPWWLIQP